MNAIQGYLEKLGGNFLVAAFIPSLAFVIASIVTFGPVIPEGLLLRIQFYLNPLGEFGLVIILIAVIIGFTLTSLNTQIYKLFEGYFFFNHFPYFRERELKRSRQYQNERQNIIRQIDGLEKRLEIWDDAGLPARSENELERINKRIQQLKNKRDDIAALFDQYFPPNENLILPTRLGNILRAAESYPLTRWGIDSVPMWPRMIYSVSRADKGSEFLSKVDFSNDQCSFLLNASLLAVVYAILSLIASFYQGITIYFYYRGYSELLYFIPINSQPRVYLQRIFIYLIICLVGVIVSWQFYNASLWNVSQYGNLIRSTYDLFRFNLLESFHLKLPDNNKDDIEENEGNGPPTEEIREPLIWRRLSELISIGKVNSPIYLEYSHPRKSDD